MSSRKESSDRLKVPVQERDTLIPCAACLGNGLTIGEDSEGNYLATQCRWCQGSGGVDRKQANKHARWMRILTHNKRVQACQEK